MTSTPGRHQPPTMQAPTAWMAAVLLALALGACGEAGEGGVDGGRGGLGGARWWRERGGGDRHGGRNRGRDAGTDPFVECMRPQEAPRVPPNLVIALDTSEAMNDVPCTDCGAPTRWASAVAGINAVLDETQADVRWGLVLIGDV